MVIYWAQLFHFYQPPTQTPQAMEKICNESYRPLLEVLRQNPHIRITVNINGGLLQTLHDYGHRDIIINLRSLAEKGNIEFTGSAKYHPVLPLLPLAERKRQINLNTAAGVEFLGGAYQPRGFFPPEMAYSGDILPEIIATGHQWMLLSGVACPDPLPVNRIYQVQSVQEGIPVFFRDDALSDEIGFKQTSAIDFLERLKQKGQSAGNIYVVTAIDVESFRQHNQSWEGFLRAVYERLHPERNTGTEVEQPRIEYTREEPATVCPNCGTKFLLVFSGELPHEGNVTCPACQSELIVDFKENLKTAMGKSRGPALAESPGPTAQKVEAVMISALLSLFPQGEAITPRASSWNTSAGDIQAGNPYPLWRDKDNEIHNLQWEHLYLCIDIVNKAQDCADGDECRSLGSIARVLLDKAEYSHHFWWASRQPTWDINLIQLGLIDQWRAIVNAFRAINKSGADGETKASYYRKVLVARDIRNKIMDRLFVL